MAKLTTKQRSALPAKDFAGPDRSYPVNDRAHAANAKSRAAQHASPALKKKIDAKANKILGEDKKVGSTVLGEKRMSQMDPFRPVGNTQLVAATTTAQSVQLSTLYGDCTSVRACNQSTSLIAYLAIGSSSVAAVVPSTGTPGTGTPLLPGTDRCFAVAGSQNWVSLISSSAAGAQINLTPGVGGYV